MENGTDQNEKEQNENLNEQSTGKPNTENDDLEYTEEEVQYADGDGTLLDDELTEQDEDDSED